jgi:putative ABC transport system permease protein
MMLKGNFKMAWQSLKSSRWQNTLTMFGVIVGIVSVITTVSLGEGVKRQVLGQINQAGSDLITVRPGKIVSRDKNGTITGVNPIYAYSFGSGSLSDDDVDTVAKTADVKFASPVGFLTASAQNSGQVYDQGFVLGTNENFPDLIGQKIEFGTYFTASEQKRHLAIIGKRVAEQLFKENVPIGRTLTIRGQDFVVRGVFDEFKPNSLGVAADLNTAIFIPLDTARELAGNIPIVQVLAKPVEVNKTDEAAKQIERNLTLAHNGQADSTVLRQDENLAITSKVLNVLTSFIAGIAGISLLVGGIGVMNIMLMAVSERTHEIGIRKAIGATTRQIRSQFIIEALVLSLGGGVLGVVLSFLVNYLLRVSTNLKPVITWPVVVASVGVAVLVGVIFGFIPAVKAARKDPIESLRYE